MNTPLSKLLTSSQTEFKVCNFKCGVEENFEHF